VCCLVCLRLPVPLLTTSTLQALLAAGGNPNARTSKGWTALMCAVGTAGEVAKDEGGRATKV
jgi:hypothetical protein